MDRHDYEVRVVTDDDEKVRLQQLAVQWCDPRFICTARAPYPTLEQVRRVHRVYAAYLDGEPVAFMLCTEKRPGWLNGKPEHIAAACAAMTEAIHHDYRGIGPAYGEIENAELRAAIVAASDGNIEDYGTGCRWIGD
jgi:hypothetical protein